MLSPDSIVVPKLVTRSSLAWMLGTAIALLGMSAYYVVTDPANRWFAVGGAVLVVAFAVGLWKEQRWFDPVAGTVSWRRWGLRTVTVPLEDVTRAYIEVGGPNVGLVLRDARRSRRIVLLTLSIYVQASQPAEILSPLAEALARHCRPKVVGGALIEIHAQVKHMARDGSPETSPLAARLRRSQ